MPNLIWFIDYFITWWHFTVISNPILRFFRYFFFQLCPFFSSDLQLKIWSKLWISFTFHVLHPCLRFSNTTWNSKQCTIEILRSQFPKFPKIVLTSLRLSGYPHPQTPTPSSIQGVSKFFYLDNLLVLNTR